MDTELIASVGTFRVFSSPASSSAAKMPDEPPLRADRMATTPVCEGPLFLSKLASNEITYLQVNNFTRAIMPRSRIWRVSDTEFIIPATSTNYWLITLRGTPRAIDKFANFLNNLCRYERFDEPEELDLSEYEEDDTEYGPLLVRRKRTPGSNTSSPNKHLPNKADSIQAEQDEVSKRSRVGDLIEKANSQTPENYGTRQGSDSVHSNIFSQESSIGIKRDIDTAAVEGQGSLENGDISENKGCEDSEGVNNDVERGSNKDASEYIQFTKETTQKSELVCDSPATDPNLYSDETNIDLAELDKETQLSDSTLVEPPGSPPLSPEEARNPEKSAYPLPAYLPMEVRLEPRFSHPLIPSSHIIKYHPPPAYAPPGTRPPYSLRRRDLVSLGTGPLHQDVTSVGGYIGLVAVKGLLRKS